MFVSVIAAVGLPVAILLLRVGADALQFRGTVDHIDRQAEGDCAIDGVLADLGLVFE